MAQRCLAFLLLILPALACAQDKAADAERTVKIDSGVLQGTVTGGVLSFKGVPYAAAPVGNLRWRAPQPLAPWNGTRPAANYARDCVQKPLPGEAGAAGAQLGEDCLYLNLWRSVSKSKAPRPVFVWIHGGGFVNGGSSAPIFDGAGLARQGLVVVAFNYRLGRLGFFMHPALKASGEASANYGLLDQLAALQWVQRNIAAFGGDPGQVTLAGESAGGISVLHHLASPASQGLFHRALVMSGGGRTYLVPGSGAVPAARAEQAGIAFAKSRGIEGTGAEALTALRALPADKVSGDLSMAELAADTYAGGPILDGKVVAGMPGDALRARTAAKVPVVIGTMADELVVLQPPRDKPLSMFGNEAGRAQFAYFKNAREPGEAVKNIGADMTMHEPARFVARQVAAAGQPAWLYRFAYVAESQRNSGATAAHAKELPFLFDTLSAVYGLGVTAEDRAMARVFIGLLSNFARTGDPNRKGLPHWPAYNPAHNEVMMFTEEAKARVETDPWKARLDLIERALDGKRTP
jgi:para-nitrobenzyl esterase